MRRKAREAALQVLFGLDAGEASAAATSVGLTRSSWDRASLAVHAYFEHFSAGKVERHFVERLVTGVAAQLKAVDAAITEVSHHWRLDRMSRVDRNLLRLATYEILWCADIPRAASINEAVEIAKRYGGQDAAPFINGVLDQIGREADGDQAPSAEVATTDDVSSDATADAAITIDSGNGGDQSEDAQAIHQELAAMERLVTGAGGQDVGVEAT